MKIIQLDQVGIHPRDTRMAQYTQINTHYTAYPQNEEKNHIVISVDSENEFDKIQHPFMMNTQNKLDIHIST
jgi:hypothetical protein